MRRKILFGILVIALLLVSLPAMAQSFTFNDIHASFNIPDGKYTIYTKDNLTPLADLEGISAQDMAARWAEQGILLQAWNTERDVCFQLTALQDADGTNYFDIDEQTVSTRGAYRKRHLSGDEFKDQGIKYTSAEWKKTTKNGRFLMLKYNIKKGGEVVQRGYARKTVRNGYTIMLDMQVFDRGLKGTDNNALNKIMDSWSFTQELDTPISAAAKISISDPPPAECNTASFTMTGTAEPGMVLTGVVMRLSSQDIITVTDTATKSGKFSLPVTLPEQGVYMMTVTVERDGEITEELSFPTTTYDKTSIPVSFIEGVPQVLTSNKLEISGTSMKGVKIQYIVNDVNKSAKVTSAGKFSFSIPTSNQGTYDIVLVFSKKDYASRRFTYTVTRTLSQSEINEKARDEAVKPAYKTLTSKLNGYDGRTLTYKAYVASIQKSDDSWLVSMAMTKKKSGYSDIFVVTTPEEPTVTLDTQVRVYGTCIGGYLMQDADGEDMELPMLQLIFWDN